MGPLSTVDTLWAGHGSQLVTSDFFGWSMLVSV